MAQVKEISTQKKQISANTNSIKKVSSKSPTKFMDEWEKGISVEEMRTNLLNKVNSRWNEKLALAKR